MDVNYYLSILNLIVGFILGALLMRSFYFKICNIFLKYFDVKINEYDELRKQYENDKINIAIEVQKMHSLTETTIKDLSEKNQELQGMLMVNIQYVKSIYDTMNSGIQIAEKIKNEETIDKETIDLFIFKATQLLMIENNNIDLN